MKEAQRQAVLDNARYLRQVRPLDPDELSEYVEGQPHPAAVRRVLREEATNLGIIEREDGTFVPVPDEPLDVAAGTVDVLLDEHAHRVEDALVEALGPNWPEGDSGERLRSRIRDLKERYFAGAPVEYDEVTALGYAVYHLPATYAAAWALLSELGADGHLPRHLHVLDVGAGVGGQALALCDLLPEDALLEYHAVEPSAAADLLEEFLAGTGRNVHPTVHREPIEAHDPDGPFDLVLCANVLSELAEPATVVGDLHEHLAADGTLVAIAPADRNTATELRKVERAVEAATGATVYAPTCRLWPGETPASTCWSFDRKPNLATPAFQRRLDDAGAGDGEFENTDVQFAYSLLRTDGTARLDLQPSADRFAKMAAMDDHVTERIDLLAVKLSHDLASGRAPAAGADRADPTARDGEDSAGRDGVEPDRDGIGPDRDGDGNPLYLVGDGSEQVDHFAVCTEVTGLNEDLLAAAYGQALVVEGALVLWNDDEGAYNLVVDGETVVDAIPE